MLLRVLRWWLPWLLMLCVSAALTHVADAALTNYTPPPPALTAAPNGHVVRIRSTTPTGNVINFLCMARPNATTVDEMVLSWADVGEFVAGACDQLLIE